MNNRKNFYITTPIYYPSGKLHIGHAYTTVLADILARYNRQIGRDVFFLTGSDEHGQKIAEKAKETKMSAIDFLNERIREFKNLWILLDISYDKFIRTTDPEHKHAVKKIFTKLLKNKHLYKSEYSGLYSIEDEEFITLTSAIKKANNYYHPQSGHKLVQIKEESYFMHLNNQSQWLINLLKQRNDFIKPEHRINELINNFISDNQLKDLSVTRTTFDWGVKVVEDPKHIVYVWIDALSNYITALGYEQDNYPLLEKYWGPDSEIVHLIGKEITRFHCVYWPVILKYLGLRQPDQILAHGWITAPSGQKMSKSIGKVIDPLILIDKYGSDPIRYYLAKAIPIGQDGPFSEELLINLYNSDLANLYGNLVSRFTKMVEKYFHGNVPKVNSEICEQTNSIENEIIKFDTHMFNKDIHLAMQSTTKIGKLINEYIEITRPFSLAKEQKNEELKIILATIYKYLIKLFVMLSPVLSKTFLIAKEQLGIDDNYQPTYKVYKGQNLFTRVKSN